MSTSVPSADAVAPPATANAALAPRIAVGIVPFILVGIGLWGFENGLAALVLYHLFAGAFPWLHGRFSRREEWRETARRLGFRISDGRRVVAWISGMTAFLAAGMGFGIFLAHFGDVEAEQAILRRGLADMGVREPSFYLVLAAYNLSFNALVEETFWRGFFLQWLDEVVSPAVSAAWNATLFTLLHLPAIVMLFPASQMTLAHVALMIGGAIWVFATRRSGSLWPAIVSHCLGANLTMLVFGYFIVIGS